MAGLICLKGKSGDNNYYFDFDERAHGIVSANPKRTQVLKHGIAPVDVPVLIILFLFATK